MNDGIKPGDSGESIRKPVPRGSATARLVDANDVNHAQNCEWFASEHSARQYVCDRSSECVMTFDVCQRANIFATYREGREV
jgi:hypothetical protein